MYSIYRGGIKKIYPDKRPISISELIQRIINNPQADTINKIRQLRIEGDQSYKVLKKNLTYITPNCVLKKRDLKDKNNFLYSSGYVFLDFDNMDDVPAFKNEFIKRYGHIVSMVCISSSAGGISVLIKVDLDLTPDNFTSVWKHLVNDVFTDVASYIDKGTKDMGRAMFVSYDPDVFSNFDNQISLEPSVLKNTETKSFNEKGASQCITLESDFNTLSCTYPYSLLEYTEVHGQIITQTPVDVSNPVIDYNPVDFTSVRFPNKIKDGTKHRVYTLLIHYLVHLNPQLKPDYIYSFIYYLNKSKAEPRMDKTELQNLFKLVYNKTQAVGYVFDGTKIKSFHINRDAGLDKTDKMILMNKCNGKNRSKKSIDKILNAKSKLMSLNEIITQKRVAEISGVSLRTVKKYYHVAEPIDIISLTSDINKQYKYVSTVTTTFNTEYTSTNTTDVVRNVVTDDNDWKQLDSLF